LLKDHKELVKVQTDFVFVRIFISEEAYARLGYKDYSLTDEYLKLLERLNSLNYNIHYLALYLEMSNYLDKDIIEKAIITIKRSV